MKPLLTIFSYSGQDDMLERHWPWFQKANCDIAVISPLDAPCKMGGMQFGKSQHYGSELIKRTLAGFRCAAGAAHDESDAFRGAFYFVEGDSICLNEAPRELEDGLHCFLWQNQDVRFKATQYPHWVWGMNLQTLGKIIGAWSEYSAENEMGFPDRFMGMVCEEKDIPMIHSPKLCYSRNRLDTPEYINEARQAIAGGITFLHGIKTADELQNVTE